MSVAASLSVALAAGLALCCAALGAATLRLRARLARMTTGADGAARVAERPCYVIRKHAFADGPAGSPVRVTVTIGAAVLPDHGSHAATLLRRADEALAAAKRDGPGTWRMAQST